MGGLGRREVHLSAAEWARWQAPTEGCAGQHEGWSPAPAGCEEDWRERKEQ